MENDNHSQPEKLEQATSASLIIPGAMELLSSTYRFYTTHWNILRPIVIVQFLLAAGINLSGVREGVHHGLAVTLLAIVIALFIAITAAALLAVVTGEGKPEGELAGAYKKGLHLFIPLVWIGILQFFIMCGFVLTFVLPAYLINSLWVLYIFGFLMFIPIVFLALFSNYILFTENKRGLSAIAASWAYIKPRFWTVLGRAIAFGCAALIAFIPLAIVRLLLPGVGDQIANAAFSAFFQPFNVIYLYLLYKAVRTIPEQALEPVEEASIKRYITWAARWGLLLAVVFIVLFGYLMFNGAAEDSTTVSMLGAPTVASIYLMLNLLR